jgi:hypothetical protein
MAGADPHHWCPLLHPLILSFFSSCFFCPLPPVRRPFAGCRPLAGHQFPKEMFVAVKEEIVAWLPLMV